MIDALYFKMTFFLLLFFVSLMIFLILLSGFSYYYPLIASARIVQSNSGLAIHDTTLEAAVIYEGLDFPSNMAFLAPNDILVLEKENGKVQRIVNGNISQDPVLDVNVANEYERGMLGIAVAKNETISKTYVFLSYTEAEIEDSDDCPKPNYCEPSHVPLGNRLYRYEWDNSSNKLINPKLLLDLPAVPGPSQDGEVIGRGTIGDAYPLNLYYAYGLRNSYGMDFDPLTNLLWDTENGPSFGDEINLVEAGFNSGWKKIQGIWELKGATYGNVTSDPEDLVDFQGRGKYRAPEFTWFNTTGPTALIFLDSDKLGEQYQNDIFVSDFHGGNIYHFDLNQNRTHLALEGPLADRVADTAEESQGILFGEGFGPITDLQIGPDGYLYVVSEEGGTIYKIIPMG